MNSTSKSRLPDILKKHEAELLNEWIQEQKATLRQQSVRDSDLRKQCIQFLGLLLQATQDGNLGDIDGPRWQGVREMLTELSRMRSQQGFSPSETALFLFSLKKPLFVHLRGEVGRDADAFADEIWQTSQIIDRLGLFTTEAYQKSREDVITRQQQDMLELSTPVVKLWDGILAVPLIGTLDSARTQTVMENLLQTIVTTGAEIAIIDITGVPTVDTLVAQHLIKTVTAARLMGAECIISGIRPQIAQTIVHLGVDLGNVSTKASLAEALKLALQRAGLTVVRSRAQA